MPNLRKKAVSFFPIVKKKNITSLIKLLQIIVNLLVLNCQKIPKQTKSKLKKHNKKQQQKPVKTETTTTTKQNKTKTKTNKNKNNTEQNKSKAKTPNPKAIQNNRN